ncbi:MAG: dihydrofolate reductase [Ignavibacteriae bacterium]|nr:dihydrofolate reductase [Ignavibacteriota bacterium]
MKLIIIAALSRNRVIGNKGKLPWHIPEDLKRFKQLTTGHTILMGRKTFESLGKPLPNRRNVVLTSRTIPNIETYANIDQALKALQDQQTVYITGGGEIFSQMIEKVDEMNLTIIDKEYEGDAFFPPYEHLIGKTYKLVSKVERDGYAFEDYVRI